jgi:hypothetical protein
MGGILVQFKVKKGESIKKGDQLKWWVEADGRRLVALANADETPNAVADEDINCQNVTVDTKNGRVWMTKAPVVTYSCPDCKGKNVQLSFPCWVDANDIDNKEKYELDEGAQPEKDSEKGFCLDCSALKQLDKEETDEHVQHADAN